MTFAQGTFYVLAAVTIISALGVVVVRNVVYSALLLILTLSLTGLVYLYLYADFLALVQILIYGGTVSVLLLFALMLTRPEQYRVRAHTQWPLAVVAAIVVFVVLAYQALATDWLGGRTPVLERAGPRCARRAALRSVGGAVRDRLGRAARGLARRAHSGAPHGGRVVIPLEHFLLLSAALFAIGTYGLLARRNAVLVLISIELLLNAVAINLVAFATYLDPGRVAGIIIAIFVITIAAAELGLGLAIVLRVYRLRSSVNVDEVDTLRW